MAPFGTTLSFIVVKSSLAKMLAKEYIIEQDRVHKDNRMMVDNSLFINLFVALAGISIAAIALVSLILRFAGAGVKEEDEEKASKLSELPPFKQSIGLLFLSFASCVAGLLLSLIFSGVSGLIRNNWAITTVNLILLLLPLAITIAFMYAAIGELLRSILDLKGSLLQGGAPKHFKPMIRCMNNSIIKLGDYLARGLFK